MEEKQLLLKVPEEFKKWLKSKSVQTDVPMKEIVVQAVEEYFNKQKEDVK